MPWQHVLATDRCRPLTWDSRRQVIDRSPCVHLIRKLEDCMIEHNRNFSKCQSGNVCGIVGPERCTLLSWLELSLVCSNGGAKAVPHKDAGGVESTRSDA